MKMKHVKITEELHSKIKLYLLSRKSDHNIQSFINQVVSDIVNAPPQEKVLSEIFQRMGYTKESCDKFAKEMVGKKE